MQGFANNAGAPNAGTDHFYDDGYNRVDSSGNAGNLTSYWGYQNAAQDNGGSVTMNSSQNILDAQSGRGQQTEGQPAIEIYWQKDLTENEKFNVGLRASLCWQHIDLDSTTTSSTTVETISDTYTYGGILPGAPFNGSYTGPNFLLGDTPDRTISYTGGTPVTTMRSLQANLFSINFGPTLSLDLTKKLRLSVSGGGTAAWIDSEFSFHDVGFAEGKDHDNDWLFGAYVSADLSYRVDDSWGIFGGAAYTCLQDFQQESGGRSSELQFGGSCTVHTGIFFQ